MARLLLRGREQTYLQAFLPSPSPTLGRALPDTPPFTDAPVKAGYDASSGVAPLSPDGRLVAIASKDAVEIYSVGDGASPPALQCTVAQPGVVCASFSPLGDLLLTWHRKKDDKEGGLAGVPPPPPPPPSTHHKLRPAHPHCTPPPHPPHTHAPIPLT